MNTLNLTRNDELAEIMGKLRAVRLKEKAEQQTIALTLVRKALIRFCDDWKTIRERRTEEGWLSAADECLDRYAHQIYDMAREVCDLLPDDMACDIRALCTEMIKTANILHMIGYDEEYQIRGDRLAEEVLMHCERYERRGRRGSPVLV